MVSGICVAAEGAVLRIVASWKCEGRRHIAKTPAGCAPAGFLASNESLIKRLKPPENF
jgi:hypothetical protein